MRYPTVNHSEQAVNIDLRSLIRTSPSQSSSSIDDYYEHRTTLLQNSLPTSGQPNPTLLQALLLGVVSSTEFFFRDLLSRMVRICPIARKVSSGQTLSLGSVHYCGSQRLGFGLMENTSFCDPKSLSQATKKYLDWTFGETTSVGVAVKEFGTVCQIRHALVHSRGYLADRNARELGLELTEFHELALTASGFQELLAACDNVVRAYNRFVFEKTIERWVTVGILIGEWSHDKTDWSSLWSCCYSRFDNSGTPVSYNAWRTIKQDAAASAQAQGFAH